MTRLHDGFKTHRKKKDFAIHIQRMVYKTESNNNAANHSFTPLIKLDAPCY